MTIKYKILALNPSGHSILVRYYTDIMTPEKLVARRSLADGSIEACKTDYSIDLPVPAPTGEDLHMYIMMRAPVQWLETMEKVLDDTIDTTLDSLSALVGVEMKG